MNESKRTRLETRRWPEGQRLCRSCNTMKANEEFHLFKKGVNGRYPHCKQCRKPISAKHWAEFPNTKKMLARTKSRATARGIPFNLALEDIVVPEKCPVLGIRLDHTGGQSEKSNSPSLDKIVPSLGYVKGNVRVISHRANMLKNNASVEEMELVLADLRKLRQEQ